jgi:regulatory protein YycI of two-component signal transduction system YycFG
MKNKNVFLLIEAWTSPVQQVIREGVMVGHHNKTDEDLIDDNIAMYTRLKQQAESGNHISIKKLGDESAQAEAMKHLSSIYKKSIKMNMINQINISFSEN